MAFKPVSSQMDFPVLERELLEGWYRDGIIEKYLHKNDQSTEQFSFLDGPITANNPMGVHHAWGRTYKDTIQRFHTMRGDKQRYQNGFDEQGLWVEVEVEKELGLHSKKDILNLVPGDEIASLEKFVNLCKERVAKYSGIQTEQSKRLGYFMDWENSYHTSSEINNYTIWNFLKTVWEKGWLYKGHDSVPWCPRCGTAISQHEILTEEYKEVVHDSIFFELPIVGREHEFLLVWTTTPWTIPANVAVAVDPEKDYVASTGEVEGNTYYLLKSAAEKLNLNITREFKGQELVDLEYTAAFDHLPRVKEAFGEYKHRVVATDPLVLPITEEDGTGLVHIAPGAGAEDFKLGKALGLPVIEVIDEGAFYLDGMDNFSGVSAKAHPEVIVEFLTSKEDGKYLFKVERYKHRYPTCWRCKTELVWRVVDEWYISMDKTDASGKTYREQMTEVAKQINWMPKWGEDRELDWLKNMHDWLISKKRFWGLALPIWVCDICNKFEVVGGHDELKEKATSGWDQFEGHTPHKPWIDQIKIKCSDCEGAMTRIPDVGNPWLDAGIVPFSTLPEDYFPADFITESFPGQFKNWFYSLIAMSTALKGVAPMKNLLGFGSLVDEKGEEFHKSKGNSIEFNEAADKAGVDVIRWLYVTATPENNLKFGYKTIDEIRRQFYLIFWNSYKFFVDYASITNWHCELESGQKTVLDRWILARLTEVVLLVNDSMEKYDMATASRAIEDFVVNDFSTWYIRRIRDRVGPNADEKDQNTVLSILYGNLVTLSKLTAPFMPFISEEIYRNLTEDESVHLVNYPLGDKSLLDEKLISDMKIVRQIVELGHAKRKESEVKLRQPLAKITYTSPVKLDEELEAIIKEELNVKEIAQTDGKELSTEIDTNITSELAAEGEARDLIREIQKLRKEAGLTLSDRIEVEAPKWPESCEEMILNATAASKISQSENLKISKI